MRYPRQRQGHFIDTRLSVDTGGDWKAYTGTVPKDCAVIGTVTLGESDTGALVRLAGSKNYVKVNDGQIAMLNQQRIATALQMAQQQIYAPEMVSVEEWERTHPPCGEDSDGQHRTGQAGSVVTAQRTGYGGPLPSGPRR